MNDNNSSKQILLSVIGVAILVIAVVGISFAFFTYTRTGARNNVINTGSISFAFNDSEFIWLENQYPITYSQGLSIKSNGTTYITETPNDKIADEIDGGLCQFTIVGSASSGTVNYNIYLVPTTIASGTTETSENGLYSIDGSTKDGTLLPSQIMVNIQSSGTDIFTNDDLVGNQSVNDTNSGSLTFVPYTPNLVTTDRTIGGVLISDLLLITDTNYSDIGATSDTVGSYLLGTGAVTGGDEKTRYFELRMFIPEYHVALDNDVTFAEENANGVYTTTGYYTQVTRSDTLQSDTHPKWYYSTGSFAKKYYSMKIRIDASATS